MMLSAILRSTARVTALDISNCVLSEHTYKCIADGLTRCADVDVIKVTRCNVKPHSTIKITRFFFLLSW